MKRLLKAAAALLCVSGLTAFASNSSVIATLTDSDGQTWNNCTWSATLSSPRGGPTINGIAVAPSLQLVQGACSSSGILSGMFVDVNSLDQAGATYSFTMQPNASVPPTSVAGVVVTGASQNLSATLSGSLQGPRFNASPSAYGYADVEVNQQTPLGGIYYNVNIPCQRHFNLAGWTCSASTLTSNQLGILYGFGDSLVGGAFATLSSTSTFGLLARDFPGGNATNFAVGGTLMAQIGAWMAQKLPAPLTPNQLPTIFLNGGSNDGQTLGATTGALNNYAVQLSWAEYFGGLMPANRIMASAATLSGFAATYTGPALVTQPGGTPKQSITVGDTVTFTGTAVGNEVGLDYVQMLSGTGTFTVSLNGVLQTDLCSGTTTFSGFGCNSQAVAANTFARQEFPVSPGSAYTLVVTVTGTTGATNIVGIVALDNTPTSSAGLPTLIMNGVSREYLDAASSSLTPFNTLAQSITTQAIADHLNAYFVNVRTGNPGVNTTTDMAASTTACPALAGNTPVHFNNCGYLHWAQTVENAVPGVFVPGSGGQGTYFGPITSYALNGASSLTVVATNINTGGLAPTSTTFVPVYCSTNPANFISCTGLNWSATQGTYTNALFSGGTAAIQHCTSSANPASCTDSAYWDILGNQHALAGYIGPATAPTIGNACPTNGVWQFTQDGHGSVCLGLVWTRPF